jgi:hypothetical protein
LKAHVALMNTLAENGGLYRSQITFSPPLEFPPKYEINRTLSRVSISRLVPCDLSLIYSQSSHPCMQPNVMLPLIGINVQALDDEHGYGCGAN